MSHIWPRSLYLTFKDANIRDIPIINTNSLNRIKGTRKSRYVIFIPKKSKRGKRTANSIMDPIRFAQLLDMIRIHLGKYTPFTKEELPIIDHSDIAVLTVKNRQTKRTGRMKSGYSAIPDLSRMELTSHKMIIIASGFRSDQKNPKMELRYLSLNSLLVKILTSPLYLNNSHCSPMVDGIL